MRPAVWPRADRGEARLLHVDLRSGALSDRTVAELPALLRTGDALVVNDAGTLPASLLGDTARGPVELRLLGPGDTTGRWPAVVFGAGDWRQRTEDRPAPAPLGPGDTIELRHGLRAVVERVAPLSPRLLEIRFLESGALLWSLLYRAGRPVQYSHLVGPLSLWHVQTPFSARPWAVEMPSAGRPLGLGLLAELKAKGIALAGITHAAGLSATGDPVLDAALPLPERYEVGESAVATITQARVRRGRVVAVGTSVVRALEGAAQNGGGVLQAGEGVTELRLGPTTRRRVVDGLFTGVHEPGTSHFELTRAFAPDALLGTAHRHAESSGYLGHEFGDYELLLAA